MLYAETVTVRSLSQYPNITVITFLPSRNLVAVIFDDENGEAEKTLTEAVRGDVERDPEDISGLTDWDLVAKAHKGQYLYDVHTNIGFVDTPCPLSTFGTDL